MRALFIWLAAGTALAGGPDRHPWVEATEVLNGCYVVETNTFPELAHDLAAHLQRAHALYEDRFGPLTGTARRPMRIALFRTRDEYHRFGDGVAGAIGHFDSALDRCALAWSGEVGEAGWPVAVHEACHHYVRRRHPDARLPSWYAEGIACYFEGVLDPHAEEGVARLRVRAAKNALEDGEAGLEALLATRAQVRTGRLVLEAGDPAADGIAPARFYGLAWSLVHFLATDAGTRQAFRRFELRLLASRPPPGTEAVIARRILDEECGELGVLERRWHEHLSALPEPGPLQAAPVYAWELGAERPFVRYAALRRLQGGPLPADLRPGVLALQRDPDIVVRTAACRVLAGGMAEDAVPGMVEALDLGEPELKELAMRALAFPGAGAAVPRLLDEREDRLGALRALLVIDDPRALPLFAGALQDPLLPATLRARCSQVLGRHDMALAPVAPRRAPAGQVRPVAPPPPDPERMRRRLTVLADPSRPAADLKRACRELGDARWQDAIPALQRLCRPHVDDGVRLEAVRALVAITGETRGFEPAQAASAREAAYRAWAGD